MVIEHDGRGKFAKGNRGGPGRPKKEREEKFYEILVTSVSASDWQAIISKAVDQAKRGDAVARKWLADYLIGPPIEKKEISGSDGGAIFVTLKDKDD
jgi:stage V sporulation protein SpoVS